MGRHLTVSRRSETAPIDAMLWLLEPDVRLVDTQTFSTLGAFAAWLRRAIDVSVSWTDELKADAELAMTVAEILGTAPGDPSLPTVNGTDGTETFPFPPAAVRTDAENALGAPHTFDSAGRLDSGRPKGQRHRR